MPTLEERIQGLYLRTGQVITEDWYAELVSVLKDLSTGGAVTYEGYVLRDLKPQQDLVINLGEPDLRFREVHAGYGYFTYEVFVAGKRVLKDGDPICISDIYPEAQEKITTAIDQAKVTGYTAELPSIRQLVQDIKAEVSSIETTVSAVYGGYSLADIYSKLASIEERLLVIEHAIEGKGRPKLLAYRVSYDAPDLADIFPEDVLVEEDGRVRVKLVMERGGLAYLKHYLACAGTEVTALLNAGTEIPANAWQEFDVVAMKGDRVNIRVTPGQRVTVLLYNVDEV